MDCLFEKEYKEQGTWIVCWEQREKECVIEWAPENGERARQIKSSSKRGNPIDDSKGIDSTFQTHDSEVLEVEIPQNPS